MKHIKGFLFTFLIFCTALLLRPVGTWAAEISGRAWRDLDINGVQESPELGDTNVPEISIDLYDSGDVLQDNQTVTGDNPNYSFEGLSAGDYYLKIAIPDGTLWDLVSKDVGTDDDIDSDFDPVTLRTDIISLGSVDTIIDNIDVGGYTGDWGCAVHDSISGVLFEDVNMNDYIDADENPISGVDIDIIDNQGNLETTVTTGADGSFVTGNLPLDHYVLEVDVTSLTDITYLLGIMDFEGDGVVDGYNIFDPNTGVGDDEYYVVEFCNEGVYDIAYNRNPVLLAGNVSDGGNFGEVDVEDSDTKTLNLTNEGAPDLIITDLRMDGDSEDFTVSWSGTDCEDGVVESIQNCTLTVTFNPQSAGSKEAYLRFNTNDPLEPAYEVRVWGEATAVLSQTGVDYRIPVSFGVLSILATATYFLRNKELLNEITQKIKKR